MSGRNYDKAKTVVAAAEADPGRFGPVVEQMDATGKVDPAFQQVKGHSGGDGVQTEDKPAQTKGRQGKSLVLKPRSKPAAVAAAIIDLYGHAGPSRFAMPLPSCSGRSTHRRVAFLRALKLSRIVFHLLGGMLG